jgi:hypothetical protein
MNTIEYSNLHLHLLGTPHVNQMVKLLVPDHLILGYNPHVHLWERDTVQVVVHLK